MECTAADRRYVKTHVLFYNEILEHGTNKPFHIRPNAQFIGCGLVAWSPWLVSDAYLFLNVFVKRKRKMRRTRRRKGFIE